MYYNDDYFVKYYNDPVFVKPPLRFSKHAIQRQNERIPKTHIGEKNVNIIKNNTVVTTITKSKQEFPIQDKLKQYMYHNKSEFDKDLIGKVIGKKGSNIKTLIYKVKCLVYTSDFDYCIDRTVVNNKCCIYILANNKNILTIATNELNSNLANVCITNSKK